jgi:ribosome-binding factor A
MASGSRPSRIGEELRVELSDLLTRSVHDPGIGFLTITHVKVTPDLQIARVYYTTLGDERARRESRRALERAAPFLRRQIGGRLRLRRVPQLEFFYDESIERGDRIERILQDLSTEARPRTTDDGDGAGTSAGGSNRPEEASQRDERRQDDE